MVKNTISFVIAIFLFSIPYMLGTLYKFLGTESMTNEPTYIVGLSGTIIIIIVMLVLHISTITIREILFKHKDK